MALKLYRRHTADCSAGDRIVDGQKQRFYEVGARSYESDEGKRGVKKCVCLIHASGTLGGRFHRKCTNQFRWEEAKELTAKWETAGSWDKIDAPPQAAPVTAEETKPVVVTVERAVKAWVDEIAEHAAEKTRKKYRLLMKKFEKYSEAKGYISVERWDSPIDIREFRSSWNVSTVTAAKNMTTMRSFFEFCFVNGWLPRNPAKLVKNPRSARTDTRNEQKLPFSDAELKKQYEMCDRWGTHQIRCYAKKKNGRVVESEVHYREYARKWTGQDLADFISVSVYTGLRILQVATFHISRMNDNGEIHVRTQKNGAHVYTWVPEWLQERIRIRAKEVGPYIFGEHTTKDTDVITDVWRRKLKRLWEVCGPWKEKPTPHRYRHTFARILLERDGVTVRDVAELLGDTEEMVRKHYAAWVPGRQERLTAVLKGAFSEKPKPNVVPFPKKTGTE